MTLDECLRQARRQLAETLELEGDEARVEAGVLLQAALGGRSRAWLMAHGEYAPTPEQSQAFDGYLHRRLQGEPVAYILGWREFYGLEFHVTPDVLIPRPDTETLVEAALLRIPVDRASRVLDLGAGSGAIAIAIAKQRPQATVLAVDRSPEALAVARRNAGHLGAGNLALKQSDWYAAMAGELFDVIVSNPPYIAAGDVHLAQGDVRFEPKQALVSGVDGLDDIRRIVAESPSYLADGGWLLLEHGYEQADSVAGLLRAHGFIEVDHVADLAGIRRVTLGRKPG